MRQSESSIIVMIINSLQSRVLLKGDDLYFDYIRRTLRKNLVGRYIHLWKKQVGLIFLPPLHEYKILLKLNVENACQPVTLLEHELLKISKIS